MSTKSAQNGQAVKAPAKKPAPSSSSVASRVERLEGVVLAQQKTIDQLSKVLALYVEHQAVTTALRSVENNVRAAIKQQIAEKGFAAALPAEDTPQP